MFDSDNSLADKDGQTVLPTSQPILKKIVVYGLFLVLGLGIAAGVVGWVISSQFGFIAAVAGAAVAGVFMSFTAGAMVFANRFMHSASYVQVLFGCVLGAFFLKIVFFLVTAFLVKGTAWLDPKVFFITVVVGVALSLLLDLLVILKHKLPAVSDVQLH
ncbi:hypothetical protein KJY77_00550 [Canibacter sp. lx-72]|uniref:hypothetical protein n=1 Tax=Canibacter zhuwentaonis TaxID=2837491 RepID=UPI001BDD856C|nr:hypothetical protein [Canibacter zhuwentaonis]MBT1017637.1 hypothetical protein [Canibacter zhuwentaonis]